jgi:hypothetical protein
LTLNFTYEDASNKGIGQKHDGRFDKSSKWRDTCQERLDRERALECGPRYVGCLSWMNDMADYWKIVKLEVRDEGRFVCSCDMFATLQVWDEEFAIWKSEHRGREMLAIGGL